MMRERIALRYRKELVGWVVKQAMWGDVNRKAFILNKIEMKGGPPRTCSK